MIAESILGTISTRRDMHYMRYPSGGIVTTQPGEAEFFSTNEEAMNIVFLDHGGHGIDIVDGEVALFTNEEEVVDAVENMLKSHGFTRDVTPTEPSHAAGAEFQVF